jgi:hypothetical protein
MLWSGRFPDFLMAPSFFNSNNCTGSVLSKNWRLCIVYWPPADAKSASDRRLVAYKLYPSGRQSHANCTRLAASQCNMNKIDRNLPATGGHIDKKIREK